MVGNQNEIAENGVSAWVLAHREMVGNQNLGEDGLHLHGLAPFVEDGIARAEGGDGLPARGRGDGRAVGQRLARTHVADEHGPAVVGDGIVGMAHGGGVGAVEGGNQHD